MAQIAKLGELAAAAASSSAATAAAAKSAAAAEDEDGDRRSRTRASAAHAQAEQAAARALRRELAPLAAESGDDRIARRSKLEQLEQLATAMARKQQELVVALDLHAEKQSELSAEIADARGDLKLPPLRKKLSISREEANATDGSNDYFAPWLKSVLPAVSRGGGKALVAAQATNAAVSGDPTRRVDLL